MIKTKLGHENIHIECMEQQLLKTILICAHIAITKYYELGDLNSNLCSHVSGGWKS